jgi:putative endonuclease
MSITLRKGLHYEKRAREYLQRQGLEFLQANYRCRLGEIDLIMRDGDTVCFIEVRFRKSAAFGGAGASITPGKQRKIVKAARFFLLHHERLAERALRFDALLIQQQGGASPDFNWIQNAFYAE